MRHKVSAVLVFILLLGQHFQLTALWGFPTTLGLLAGLTLLALNVRTLAAHTFTLVLLGALVLPLANAIFAQQAVSTNDFIRTLALLTLSTVILTAAATTNWTGFVQSRPVKRALYISLCLMSILSVVQVALGSRGDEKAFNLFGAHQYLYQYDPHLEFVDVPRAQGFFLEPSYNAFVILSVVVALLMLDFKAKSTAALGLAGTMASQSAMGLLIVLGLCTLTVLLKARTRSAIAAFLVTPTIVLLVGHYLQDRLASLATAGSSAHYRLVAPLTIVDNIFTNHPLGWPLGTITDVVSQYGLLNGAGLGSSLDNGFYVIIFYFGLPGAVMITLTLVVVILTAVRQRSRGFLWMGPLWMFASVGFSGGIFLPEYCLTVALVIAAYRSGLTQHARTAVDASSCPTSVRDSRDLSRLRGGVPHPVLPRRAESASRL